MWLFTKKGRKKAAKRSWLGCCKGERLSSHHSCLSVWKREWAHLLSPALVFRGGVTKWGFHPVSEGLSFSIPFKSTHICDQTFFCSNVAPCSIMLLNWRYGNAPEAPGLCLKPTQCGRDGCLLRFTTLERGQRWPWIMRSTRRDYLTWMLGLEVSGIPWMEPTHSRLVTLHDGTEPGCDRWFPWIWDWILALTV